MRRDTRPTTRLPGALAIALLGAGCGAGSAAPAKPASPWAASYAGSAEGNFQPTVQCTTAPAPAMTPLSTVILTFSPSGSDAAQLNVALNTLESQTAGSVCPFALSGVVTIAAGTALLDGPIAPAANPAATETCQPIALTLTGATFTPSSGGATMQVQLEGTFGTAPGACTFQLAGTFSYWTGQSGA